MTGHFFHSLNEPDKDKINGGGKGNNILKLQKIGGINIPATWILENSALKYFIVKNRALKKTEELIKNYIVYNDRGSLFAELAHMKFPSDLKREIFSKIPKNKVIIIRSSGTMEDSSKTSLAGHYESIISKTSQKEVVFTIKTCWLIAIRVYLDQIYSPGSDPDWGDLTEKTLTSVSLVFQEVINGAKSGIYFNRSPVHKDRAFMVANWGTCHSLVSGRMANDDYILKDGQPAGKTIRYKFEMTVLNKKKGEVLPGEGCRTPLGKSIIHLPFCDYIYSAKVPHPYNRIAVLSDYEIIEIGKTAEKIKEKLNYEPDLEWSVYKGKLFILQSRPITTEGPKKDIIHKDAEYITASPGRATGPIKIVTSPSDINKINEGDIIAVSATDPDFMPIFYKTAGIISDEGSPLCHTAIVARELKIPCILGVSKATRGTFYEEEIITLDADRGKFFREAKKEINFRENKKNAPEKRKERKYS